jgi:threonine/homoserine/homoserine lactone efflux protein
MFSALVSYATISALVAVSPGPSNFLAARNGGIYGLRAAAVAITGHMSAVLLLALLCALGIGAMLAASQQLFTVVKFAGAAYLIYLGYKMLKANKGKEHLWRGQADQHCPTAKLWLEHFLVAVANPKALLFFTALLPQFIDLNEGLSVQFAVLLGISLCSSFIFPFSYALLANRALEISAIKKLQRWFSKASGLMFLGFGFALALSR